MKCPPWRRNEPRPTRLAVVLASTTYSSIYLPEPKIGQEVQTNKSHLARALREIARQRTQLRHVTMLDEKASTRRKKKGAKGYWRPRTRRPIDSPKHQSRTRHERATIVPAPAVTAALWLGRPAPAALAGGRLAKTRARQRRDSWGRRGTGGRGK